MPARNPSGSHSHVSGLPCSSSVVFVQGRRGAFLLYVDSLRSCGWVISAQLRPPRLTDVCVHGASQSLLPYVRRVIRSHELCSPVDCQRGQSRLVAILLVRWAMELCALHSSSWTFWPAISVLAHSQSRHSWRAFLGGYGGPVSCKQIGVPGVPWAGSGGWRAP